MSFNCVEPFNGSIWRDDRASTQTLFGLDRPTRLRAFPAPRSKDPNGTVI
jgi:hypothetical protein